MIKLQNVYKEYLIGGETFTALSDISLEIKQKEFTAIIGPSGSGKSTLMHMIGLLDLPSRGTIHINDKDISKLNDNELSTLRNEFVGFVFQQFNLINKLTILENITLPTLFARKKLSYTPNEKAMYLIERFGLKGKEHSYPNRISGGQQQRVAIARSLIMEPTLILADEPTGNLDTKTGDTILNLLEDLNKKDGVTIVMITHEADVAKRARRTFHIRDGQLVSS